MTHASEMPAQQVSAPQTPVSGTPSTPDSPVRVLLADDQPLLLQGIATILDAQPDLQVIGTASSGQEAVEIAERLRPHVICMDIEMPGMDGIEATARVRGSGTAEVIMLTTFNREDYLLRALQAGASGFLLKTASPEQLAEGIRTVAGGEALLAPEVTRSLIRRAVRSGNPRDADVHDGGPGTREPRGGTAPDPLSEREVEVLSLAARGLSNAEIGVRLFIGAETVKTHMSRVLAKLHLRNRVEAVAYAYHHRIVTPDGDPT
ncbi:response regulator transcription factor [Nesterenkonia xinjiangensis]|uniref:DNA-binding NarL/FixJ family response regulator n=1 Tax=Nesterenkonia xinjiangensis TaxID=225327 RepID=A0A7Z0KAA8_9MICC|nr:DNA-binding NarL/FixJ family response regulator [Nesterenkonia xinjiangensis]